MVFAEKKRKMPRGDVRCGSRDESGAWLKEGKHHISILSDICTNGKGRKDPGAVIK